MISTTVRPARALPTRVEASLAVEASDDVQEVVVGDDGDAAARTRQWLHHRPLVRLRVEHLSRVEAVFAVKPSYDVYFTCRPQSTLTIANTFMYTWSKRTTV